MVVVFAQVLNMKIMGDDLMDRIAALGAVPDIQPSFVVTDVPWVKKVVPQDVQVSESSSSSFLQRRLSFFFFVDHQWLLLIVHCLVLFVHLLRSSIRASSIVFSFLGIVSSYWGSKFIILCSDNRFFFLIVRREHHTVGRRCWTVAFMWLDQG